MIFLKTIRKRTRGYPNASLRSYTYLWLLVSNEKRIKLEWVKGEKEDGKSGYV